MTDSFPSYADLPVQPDAPSGASWGVFGAESDMGTLNFIDRETRLRAIGLIQRADVFALSWALGTVNPGFYGRRPLRHTHFRKLVARGELPRVRDDFVEDFWPQGSSHWDGLRHYAVPDGRLYGGVQPTYDEQSDAPTSQTAVADQEGVFELAGVEAPSPDLGVDHWARRGIVCRAVLIDAERHFGRHGENVDIFQFKAISPATVETILQEQGVALQPGDIILLRTGWTEAYDALSPEGRVGLGPMPGSPGLYGEDVPAFLWDHRIAGVAADNPSVEATVADVPNTDPDLHDLLIARLGMAIGELWDLSALAADCERDGRYEMCLTSAPWNLRGAAGSPANAMAIK